MARKEEGFVLPLMLGLLLMTAALLLMLSARLEIKAASYARTRDYLRMNVLEQEALQVLGAFLTDFEVSDQMIGTGISERFSLSRGALLTVEIDFLQNSLEMFIQIVYNDFVRERELQYRFGEGVVFLE
ncbi:MAG: hypothetical protein FWE07_01790 [Turicibacter sp.]|nr:hypothetical protein [Turicibacter sp.]